uniref:Lysosome-associated membrane glycoprotein 3 n=1 Tax=Nannospalax galili TaxID=1026970 RepID=A0A8C6W5L8_NANGA
MPVQLSAVALLLLSLTEILHGHQIRKKTFPKIRDYLQSTITAARDVIVKPVPQPTNQIPHETAAARSRNAHITSQKATEISNSENPPHTTIKITNIPVTSKRLLSSSTTIYSLVTPNNSHTTVPITEVTIGRDSIPHSPVPTTGSSPSTVNHTTRKTTQPDGQTTFLRTFFVDAHKSTTYQKPTLPIHIPETSIAATHSDSLTASPAPTVLGPALVPQPAPVKMGTYEVLNGSRLCIKAQMGIELIVQENELQRYFNIDPNMTQASGKCGSQKSSLLLNFQGGSVNVTFIKEENSYYISEVGAYLTISNTEKTYQGMKRTMMFETVIGHSFKCVNEQSIQLSAQLLMKTTNIQLQAFDFEGDCFGNVDECLSDYTVVLPVIAAVVAGLCVVGLGIYKIRHQSSGYQRI